MNISRSIQTRSQSASRPVRWARPGLVAAATAIAAASVLFVAPASASSSGTSKRVGLFSCASKIVVRPVTFVITCADANVQLTATQWSQWGSTTAVGTTRFAMNLCTPSCVASKMSYFPSSLVRLSAPVHTKAHGWLFSKLAVTYHLGGKTKTYDFSWVGDPAFRT